MERLEQRLRVWSRRLGAIVDAATLVAADGAQPEDVRRVRILRGFVVVLVLLGLETSIVFRAGLPSPDLADRVDACMLLALVCVYTALVLLRRPGRTDLAADIVLGSAMLVIVACLSVIGGIEAPLLHWLGMVPMLAVLLRGRRAALAWAGVSACVVLGLIAADASGLERRAWTGARCRGLRPRTPFEREEEQDHPRLVVSPFEHRANRVGGSRRVGAFALVSFRRSPTLDDANRFSPPFAASNIAQFKMEPICH